ncbi:MAG: FkbM family methyltransferase [Verrucomicrobiota bacterium]
MPEAIRKPLGTLAGRFDGAIIKPLQGAIFDLSGGCFKADGCRFLIPKDITSRTYRACFLADDYEAEERALIRHFLRPADTVLELGACLGIVSCVTNKILADKTRHVVVEGNPFCIPAIHRNRELNQAGFLVENAAVSNEREVTFYLHPVYVVGGTTQRKSARPVRVPARSLADLENRHGPFTTLIMDIEGAELEIFSVSAEILKNYRLVIVELHAWAIGEAGVARCREILTAAGLRFQQRAGITEAWQRD